MGVSLAKASDAERPTYRPGKWELNTTGMFRDVADSTGRFETRIWQDE